MPESETLALPPIRPLFFPSFDLFPFAISPWG